MPSLQALVSRVSTHPFEPVIGSVACVVVPTIIRMWMTPALGAALPFVTYFPAVLLATLFWGLRWGSLVLFVSGFIAAALFLEQSAVLNFKPFTGAAAGLFLFAGALILLTGTTLRNAFIKLELARVAEAARKSELQHRMKNSLAIVQAFSSYLAGRTTSVAEFNAALQARIVTLASASEVLYAEQYEICVLPGAAEAALSPFADDRISVTGPPVRLQAECCEPLMLALYELATNSYKYGALSCDEGSVQLTWQPAADDPSKCIIRWVERGGPVVKVRGQSGLGQVLLSRQRGMDAVTLNYPPEGLTCEIEATICGSGR